MKNSQYKTILPLAASFMIWLVLTIPVVVAQQSSLVINKFSGKDNIDGLARGTDVFEAEVAASIDNDERIGTEQVKLFKGTRFVSKFSECTQTDASSKSFKCLYRESFSGGSGADEYTVKLLRDDGKELAFESHKLVVDSKAPSITVQTNAAVSSSGEVDIEWQAKDEAGGSAKSCSGLKDIIFKVGTKEVRRETIGKAQCEAEGLFTYTHPFAGAREEVSLCGSATDILNQQGSASCARFVIDKQPPVIKNMSITDETGKRIVFVRGDSTVNADVTITVDGDDVARVTADFSKLVGGASSSFVRENAVVSGSTRSFQGVRITKWDDCKVLVTAQDTAGNTANQSLPCGIAVDSVGPEVLKIVADKSFNGTALLASQSVITATFKEAGIGMNEGKTYLSGAGVQGLRASGCGKQGDGWQCTWNIQPAVRTGTTRLVVSSETVDDLGNTLVASGAASLAAVVDQEPPQQPTVINRTVFHKSTEYGDLIVRDDTIDWKVRSADFSSAFANLSAIGGPDRSPGDCEVGIQTVPGASRSCTWRTTVRASGPSSPRVEFAFADAAGNTAKISDTFTLHGIVGDKSPNYFTSSTTCSPKAIDRSTAGLLPIKIYCEIKLTPLTTGAQPIIVDLGSPSQCQGTTTGVVGDIALINGRARVTATSFQRITPYLAVTLQPAPFETLSEINFNCPISIVTKIGQSVTEFPEEERVTVQVPLYNLPLGELAKARDEKIKKAVDEAKDYMAWVGTLKKVFKYFEMFCNLVSILSNIVATVSTLSVLLGLKLEFLPGGHAAASGECLSADQMRTEVVETIYGSQKAGEGDIRNVLHTFCSFVNCQIGLGEVADKLGVTDGDPNEPRFADKVFGTLGGNLLGGSNSGAYPGDSRATVNVKDSMFWSVINLCIPGIIHNLDKLRQIQCRYALCLTKDVKQGFPESACEDMKSYMLCRHWAGEFFRAFPITALVDHYSLLVRNAFSDPLSALGPIASIAMNCRNACLAGPAASKGCLLLKALSQVGQAIKDIQGIIKGGVFEVSSDWCDQLEKETEDDDKDASTEQPGNPSGTENQGEGVGGR